MITAVLLDLDGTLLDTAPDMGRALNRLRSEQGHPPLSLDHIRPVVSHGSRGLLQLGFGVTPEDGDYPALQDRFLTLYANAISVETLPFPGMRAVLATLEKQGMVWGVVTNKPGWLTDPLLAAQDLIPPTGCVVSGDTLAQRKPHPAPLLYASEQLGIPASDCVYVGDAERDIQAGRAAGMATLVANYGYLGDDDTPHAWQADGLLADVPALLTWLAEQESKFRP